MRMLRLLLLIGIIFALPISHVLYGEPYPGDGQSGFGFIMIFGFVGVIAGIVFLALSALARYFFKERGWKPSLLPEIILFLIMAGYLIHTGIKAEYTDTKTEPNQTPQTTTRTVTDRAPSSTLRASASRA